MSKEQNIVSSIINTLGDLKSERGNYDRTYQDITDYVMINNSDFLRTPAKGTRRDRRVFDSTAVQSNEQLAAVIHSGLTDPTTQWVKYTVSNPAISSRDDYKLWIDSVNRAVFEPFRSDEIGFSQQGHEALMSTTGYGTGIMWVTDDEDKGITFNTRHLSNCYITENNKGFVDAVIRDFQFSARQAAQEWGVENLGDKIKKALTENPEKKFNFVHAVLPREDFERQNDVLEGISSRFKYVSVYISEEDKKLINQSGFHEFPYIVPRWETLPGEKYGRSPTWNVMSDILMINLMAEITIKAAQKQMDPALLVPDDGVLGSLQVFPGGMIVGGIDDEGRDLVKPFNTGSRLDISLEMMEQRRDAIRSAFFVDQFQERKGVQPLTATETEDIREKRLRLIGPQVKRLQDEFLVPLVNRVFGILNRKGKIPPAPDSLRDLGIDAIDLELEFISPLAFTQKTAQLLSYNRFFASVGTFVETNPETMQNFNSDKIIRDAADLAGIPAHQMKSEGEVEDERQQQAEAIQQQQQTEQLQAGAETVAKLQSSGIPIVPEG